MCCSACLEQIPWFGTSRSGAVGLVQSPGLGFPKATSPGDLEKRSGIDFVLTIDSVDEEKASPYLRN